MLVDLESPFAGKTTAETLENIQYARKCMADSLKRGEFPIASHLLYTQPGILDDEVPEERELGIRAGKEWARFANKTVVYTDRGISRGMQFGIEDAKANGREIEYRTLEAA